MGRMVRVPKDVTKFAKDNGRKVVAMLVTTPAGSEMETVGSVLPEDAAEACNLFSKLGKLCDKKSKTGKKS